MHIETERKFLVRLPDTAELEARGCRILRIVQTYLTIDDESGEESRVRRIEESGRISYIYTEKKRISETSRFENEYEITGDEYERLIDGSDDPRQLIKTRYAFPCGGHTIEIDVYPPEIGGEELDGLAVLEVELENEGEEILFMSCGSSPGRRNFPTKPLQSPSKTEKKPINPYKRCTLWLFLIKRTCFLPVFML